MSRGSRFDPASRVYSVVKNPSPYEDKVPHMKWRERMKTDWAFTKLSRPVKTTGQALRVTLSPFWAVPDLVRPQFVREGDHMYVKPIENLVLAVRGLSPKSYKNAHQAIRRIPVFNTILQVLREWDVDAINREILLLQRDPHGRTFAEFTPLVKEILRPLFRLVRLSAHVHVLPAIAKMYEFGKMYLTSKDERDLLQRYYFIARDEVPIVFTQIRQTLYPVLLKLLSDRYVDLDTFYLDHEEAILAFLELKEDDLVRDQPDTEQVLTPQESGAAGPADPGVITPKLARQGFELLDQMFPRAGWKALGDNPDFYAYFQTIFDYPRGSEHVPVDDPLQVILPLSEILQQLFYGFQNVQWGTANNQNGEVIRLQELLDKTVARWHFFHEEFFGKNYLPLLQEYCREIERAGPLSPDAKRREHQLLWFKRNYLLPHLILPVMDDIRVKSLGYPNLAVQAREMLDLLAPLSVELEQRGTRSTAVLNPDAKVKFPVNNMVSARFQSVLRRSDGTDDERRVLDQGNNRALLFTTLTLLSALDHLLSKPGSQLYLRKPGYLYRTSGQTSDDKPVYSVPKKNSVPLLKKLNEQAPPHLDELPWPNRGDDVLGALITAEEVKRRMQEHLNDKKPFVLVNFRVWPEEDNRAFGEFIAPLLDQGTSINRQDDGSWTYVLRDTVEEEAEDFARKILSAAARRVPPLAAGALVVPFATNWTLEKVLDMAPKGWTQAHDIPPQILGVWISGVQSFEFRTDVPTVAIRTSATADALPEA